MFDHVWHEGEARHLQIEPCDCARCIVMRQDFSAQKSSAMVDEAVDQRLRDIDSERPVCFAWTTGLIRPCSIHPLTACRWCRVHVPDDERHIIEQARSAARERGLRSEQPLQIPAECNTSALRTLFYGSFIEELELIRVQLQNHQHHETMRAISFFCSPKLVHPDRIDRLVATVAHTPTGDFRSITDPRHLRDIAYHCGMTSAQPRARLDPDQARLESLIAAGEIPLRWTVPYDERDVREWSETGGSDNITLWRRRTDDHVSAIHELADVLAAKRADLVGLNVGMDNRYLYVFEAILAPQDVDS